MAKPKSKGTQLQIFIATIFTTIAQVFELSGPEAEVQTFDSTALDSGTGREFDPTGFVDGGTITWGMFFDPVAATLQALTDLITAPAVTDFKIIWSDAAATAWPFSAILTKVTPSAALDDGLKASCEAKLDGIVTYPT